MALTPASSRGGVSQASVTLTSAQVLQLGGTPITVVPAPGAGLAAIALGGTVELIYNSVAYVSPGGVFRIVPAGATGITVLAVACTGVIDQTNNAVGVFAYGSTSGAPYSPASNLTNQALQVVCSSGNPTTGNSTLTITVLYNLVALA